MDIGKFNKPRKPDRKCPYGFTCKNHPWGKNKITKDCKYYDRCKRIVRKLTKASIDIDSYEEYIDEIAEDSKYYGSSSRKRAFCYTGTDKQTSLLLEAIEKHERSVIILRKRANHQPFENWGIQEQISQVRKSLKQLESQLIKLNRGYIAPQGVELNTYNVKRYPFGKPSEENSSKTEYYKPKIYKYRKLQSKTAQFKSKKEVEPKCKIIHLGKIGSEEDIQGRLGIERRNRLLKIRTRLIRAVNALQEAAELADVEFNFDDFTEQTEDDS